MEDHAWHWLLNSAGGVVSVLGSLTYMVSRLARLELKVETMWEFTYRRALAAAVAEGNAKINSPVSVTDEVRGWFAGMVADLKAMYRATGTGLSDAEFSLAIERQFGDRIVKEICIPRSIFKGECLVFAASLAKEP